MRSRGEGGRSAQLGYEVLRHDTMNGIINSATSLWMSTKKCLGEES